MTDTPKFAHLGGWLFIFLSFPLRILLGSCPGCSAAGLLQRRPCYKCTPLAVGVSRGENDEAKQKPVGLWGAEPSLGALHADIARLHEALNEIMAAAQEDPRTFKGFHKRWSPQDPFKTDFPMHQGGAPGLHDPAWRPCLHHHPGGISQFPLVWLCSAAMWVL